MYLRMWSFLKCINRKGGVSPILKDGEKDVSGDHERADLLNRVFAEKFTDPSASFYPDVVSHSVSNLSIFEVSSGDVRRLLLSIPRDKACGPNNVGARIIRECAEELVTPLTILCQMSFDQGVSCPSGSKQTSSPFTKRVIDQMLETTDLSRCYLCSVECSKSLPVMR